MPMRVNIPTIVAAAAALAMACAIPSAPGFAQMGAGPGHVQAMKYAADRCKRLMTQFDAAKTTDQNLQAMRKQAEQYCYSGDQADYGVDLLEKALASLNLKPVP